jgi:hypothetical protein
MLHFFCVVPGPYQDSTEQWYSLLSKLQIAGHPLPSCNPLQCRRELQTCREARRLSPSIMLLFCPRRKSPSICCLERKHNAVPNPRATSGWFSPCDTVEGARREREKGGRFQVETSGNDDMTYQATVHIRLASSRLVLFFLVSSCFFLSRLGLSCLVLSCLALSCDEPHPV